jgi:uncharacterized protein YigE (DUF2233 family)
MLQVNMMPYRLSILLIAFVLLAGWSIAFTHKGSTDPNIIDYTADSKKQDIRFYWKDDSGHILGSIQRLKDYLDRKHKKLVFAMNGGMFKTGNSPVGLFIQQQATISPLDTSSGDGNFYLKPNGVFYIARDNKATICQTKDFRSSAQIRFATQSGPMLVINGTIHPAFKEGSTNFNIRNGVGILPDGKMLFAMSNGSMNFYDFAKYFKNMGCLNALYLDGFVSRTYLPEKNWIQTDGDFGVIIGVTIPEK